GIDLPAAAQQPLDCAARPGKARIAFQQQAADLAAFEQPPHAADDLVLVAVDVDLYMVGSRQRAGLDQVIDREPHASLPETGFRSVVPARLAEVVKRVAGGEIAQQQARHVDRLVADRGAVGRDAALRLVEEDVAVELGIVLRFGLESVHFGARGDPGVQAVDADVRPDVDEHFAGRERLDPVDRAGLLRKQRLHPPLTCRRADAVAQRASVQIQLGERERPLRIGELFRDRHLADVVERRGEPGFFFYGQRATSWSRSGPARRPAARAASGARGAACRGAPPARRPAAVPVPWRGPSRSSPARRLRDTPSDRCAAPPRWGPGRVPARISPAWVLPSERAVVSQREPLLAQFRRGSRGGVGCERPLTGAAAGATGSALNQPKRRLMIPVGASPGAVCTAAAAGWGCGARTTGCGRAWGIGAG